MSEIKKIVVDNNVTVRNPQKGQKWLVGNVENKLGSCMYLLQVADKCRIFHTNEIRRGWLK